MKSKKLMKGVAIATIAAMSMGMLAGCGGGKDEAKEYKVGVVQLVQHGALDQANAGMIAGLADNGFVEGENLVVKQENAQNDQSNLQSIAQSFIADEVDLILAIATPAAQVMAANTEEIPIVGTAITSFEGAGLVESDEAPGYNVTGTNDMNPVEEQVNLLLQLKPDAKVIGTIYTAAEVNSQIQVDLLDKVAAAKGLTVEKRTIQNVNDIQQAAQSLVGVADALWLPTDNNVASAMPNVVGVTDPAGIITITGEESMTVAGGTATYSFSYYDIGYNAGVMAAQILKGEADPATLPVQSPKAEDLTAVLNMEAIASLGVEVPQDLLDSAKKVNEAE
ncbi:MAG: ABC transporter substrate-binding protein [Peptococcaceae bacterium]|nr:ABC transporter substrate-binding protein [Peptococcaceae bacterium]